MKCGKRLFDDREEYCQDCQKHRHYFDRGIAAFEYSDALKKSMYAFKYNNRREYADFYGKQLLKNKLEIVKSWDAQALVPVPLYPGKLRKRGYNQAEDLAVKLGEQLKLPVITDLLYRSKNTKPQKELNDKDRKNNIENAFQIKKNSVKYKRLILIDDIYTTGATMDECAKVLRADGAESVYFMTVCIGRGF